MHDIWPKRTQSFWINLHALTGLLLWGLLMWRLGLRLRQPPRALPAELNSAARRLAQLVHFLLYALLIITPVIGIVIFIYHGRVLNLGFFQVNFGVARDREPTEDIHGLWHHFIKRNAILERMWWTT